MGGTPLPPFTDKIFGKKGVTDKIRKVVFEVLPYIEKHCVVSVSATTSILRGVTIPLLAEARAIVCT